MDVGAIIRWLQQTNRLNEMAHVTAFQGNRIAEDGEEIPVRVAVLDYGPDAGDGRYMVVAEDDDGAIASGDPAETVEAAINAVDWNDFVLEEDDEDGGY
jgi:hypothetical protein